MSTLNALLLFAGVPLLIVAVLTLLVMAPSLAKGPRYRPGQRWDAGPEWFAGPQLDDGADRRQLAAGEDSTADTGGASARW